MGSATSLSIGLAYDQARWVLLTCRHATPPIVDPEMQAGVDMIGQVVSLPLDHLGEAEVGAQRPGRDASLRTLLDLVHATGRVVRLSDSRFSLDASRPGPWSSRS